jgi:2-polyprenyl-3-methyl-5-hydroxy-6-metoxy-1,4-benzoquinol methylase
MTIDWSGTANDYAPYRAGFPDAFYERLAPYGIIGRDSESRRCLDLGTGTGALARGFARRGWRVNGIDISADMMQAARHLRSQRGSRSTTSLAAPKRPGSRMNPSTW